MKSRLWCFTNFNLDFDYNKYFKESSAQYIAYGEETCPKTGRLHHQGFVYFESQRGSIKGVAKQLGNAHVEMCKGNLDQNLDYCSKEAELTTIGVKPTQGKRTDLNALIEELSNGNTTTDDICLNQPQMYHMYGRTLNNAEDIALRKNIVLG